MLTRPILFRVKRPVEDICSDIAHFLLMLYSRNTPPPPQLLQDDVRWMLLTNAPANARLVHLYLFQVLLQVFVEALTQAENLH